MSLQSKSLYLLSANPHTAQELHSHPHLTVKNTDLMLLTHFSEVCKGELLHFYVFSPKQ